MDFGFTPPDPEKIKESMERLKDSFRRAADSAAGPAKALFQDLSDKFNKAVDDGMALAKEQNPDPHKAMMQMMPAMQALQSSLIKIRAAAQNDPAIASTLRTLEDEMRREISGMMGGNIPKPRPPKMPPRRPKGPGAGSHDLG